jgi:hypothetical protein
MGCHKMGFEFSKLDSGITLSSVWAEPYHVRIVWITFLALKNKDGYVRASFSGIQRAANVTVDECIEAIRVLESPDPDSRTPDYEGRRIEKIEGGWIVLNHEKYRVRSDIQKEQTKERVRRFREKQKLNSDSVTHCNVTQELPSVSVSVSESEKKKEDCKGKEKDKPQRNIIPPQIEWVTEYCNERKNNITPQKFFDHYSARGWMIGKNKMKDWQAAVRTWEQSGYNDNKENKPTTPSYHQRLQ